MVTGVKEGSQDDRNKNPEEEGGGEEEEDGDGDSEECEGYKIQNMQRTEMD